MEELDPRLRLAFKEAACDNLGIYCKSVTPANGKTKKRTQYQEGWNDAILTQVEYECVLASWFRSLNLLEQITVKEMLAVDADSGMYMLHIKQDNLDKNETEVILSLNVSDTFYYACADAEDISMSDLSILIPAWQKYGREAVIAYAAVKRDQPPLQELITPKYLEAREYVGGLFQDQK